MNGGTLYMISLLLALSACTHEPRPATAQEYFDRAMKQ